MAKATIPAVPLNIVAALAVKKVMEREHLTGTIKLWPGVAEELVGTKAYYVRAGMFKDVDVCLFAHVAANLGVSWGGSLNTNGLVSVEYMFKGESAHAAGAPWRGKSALDAVELMDVGWNFRREHLRLAQRVHYVITNGGDQPNVVPPNGRGLVLLPRGRLRPHHGYVAHRRQHGEGRDADDGYDCHLAAAGLARGPGTSTARLPKPCTRTSRRWGCRSGRKTTRRWRRRLQNELKQPVRGLPMKIAEMRPPRVETPSDGEDGPASRPDRRRLGRYRRRFAGTCRR